MTSHAFRLLATAGAAVALGFAAAAQDDPAEAEAPSESEVLASDAAFARECLDTLALRDAPGRVCIGLVARQCAGEADEETTAGAALCKARESDAWQALLEQVESAMEAGLPNARREGFRAAQAAWAEFRDAECAFEAAAHRAESAAEAARAACVLMLTANRVISLDELAAER